MGGGDIGVQDEYQLDDGIPVLLAALPEFCSVYEIFSMNRFPRIWGSSWRREKSVDVEHAHDSVKRISIRSGSK